jgi:hypothetical protein
MHQILAHTYFIKSTLLDLQAQIGPYTIIVGDFNIPLSQIDRSARQKKSAKKIQI